MVAMVLVQWIMRVGKEKGYVGCSDGMKEMRQQLSYWKSQAEGSCSQKEKDEDQIYFMKLRENLDIYKFLFFLLFHFLLLSYWLMVRK